jgi:prepilin-type N-terminal cleavage/methylation domain-containing protein
MRNKKSAFSLIEISIVVLIIGILVAGITQSSRLISSSKVATAQSLTQSAPVSANKGLMLWLETSMEKSFPAAQSSDGASVVTWNDMNTQSIEKLFAVTSTGTVTYKSTSTINGLPSLSFAGSAEMTLSTTAGSVAATNIQTTGSSAGANNFTFFVVYDDDSTTDAIRGIFHNGVMGTNGWGYANTATASTRAVKIGTTTSNMTTGYSRNPTITTVTYDGATAKIYTNGGTATSATVASVAPTVSMFIGGDGTNRFIGSISEIIVFDNALRDSDRKSIEEYLSKKYGIKIS